MSDTPETLAAILAEMRREERPYGISPDRIRSYADRIEAAAERERDEDRQLAAIAESDEAFARCARCDRPERAICNAAAMREALMKAKLYFDHRGEGTNLDDAGMAIDAIISIDAALAAPARNCDVGTAEEQAERHERFCAAHYKADAVDAQCFGCPASDKKETACEFVWGQLPFAPEEGGAE